MVIASPIKWHGGKSYLARKFIALMPPHTHFVEPFAGGLSVLLLKNPDEISEVVNDLDGDLSNFWRVLSRPKEFEQFQRLAEATPFSENVWRDAAGELPDLIESGVPEIVARAFCFFISVRQSLAGRRNCFAPLSRNRTRRRMNEQASAWLSAVEGLPAVHDRLKRVVILDRPAIEVIRSQDGDETLFYLDPPYLHSTRSTTGEYGLLEMSESEHVRLLETLTRIAGKLFLSGYQSELYDDFAGKHGWHRMDFELPNNAAGGTAKRRMIESVWTNFEPA